MSAVAKLKESLQQKASSSSLTVNTTLGEPGKLKQRRRSIEKNSTGLTPGVSDIQLVGGIRMATGGQQVPLAPKKGRGGKVSSVKLDGKAKEAKEALKTKMEQKDDTKVVHTRKLRSGGGMFFSEDNKTTHTKTFWKEGTLKKTFDKHDKNLPKEQALQDLP